MMRSDITAVVVHHSGIDALSRCVASLAAQRCATVLVDVSRDGEGKRVLDAAEGCTYVAAPANLGYGWACNLGVAATATPAVLVSNSDVTFTPGALDALAAAAIGQPAVVAPLQVDPVSGSPTQDNLLPVPGRAEAVTRWLGVRRRASLARRRKAVARIARETVPRSLDGYVLSGACLAFDARTFAALGGFDTAFFLYEEDVDLCLRALTNDVALQLVPTARVLHVSGTNARGVNLRSMQTARASQLLLWRKHCLPVGALRAVQLAGLALRVAAALGQRDGAAARVWFRALVTRPAPSS